jgi:ribosome-associated protein
MSTETEINQNSGRFATDLAKEAASEIQAENIHVIDVREISSFTDYFIVLSAQSTRHIKAISEIIQSTLKANGFNLHHKEGDHKSKWLLLDYGNLIVHLFDTDAREFYDIENAWENSKTIEIIQ